MQFHITNMACGGCANGVRAAIRAIDPEAQVEADLASRTVTITSTRSGAELRQALAGAGYPAAD